MKGDVFTKNKQLSQSSSGSNFFIQPEQIHVNNSEIPSKHLNDYDYNILREDAYKNINDELFKLEYKINKKERELSELENQIKLAKELNSDNLVKNLIVRKKQLLIDLDNLNDIYNESTLSAKISGRLITKFKDKCSLLINLTSNFKNYIMSHIPTRFSTFIELKGSLTKLESINKSVDELVSLQIPYGEAQNKYEQLSHYIQKANSIQSEISKHLK